MSARRPRRPPQPKIARTRCLHCGRLAKTTVLGRCPACLSIQTALASDWTVDSALVRQVVRHDGSRLALYVRHEGLEWGVHAIETTGARASATSAADNEHQSICRVTRRTLLPDALDAGERFARRWLEGAPGTAVATYVERPEARAS